MRAHHDWSSLPSPGRIVAGLAFHAAFLAVMGVPPRHAPEPGRVAYDDGGGSSFVLDLGGPVPMLVVRDRDESGARPGDGAIRAVLGRAGLPGPFAAEPERGVSGAARWDGTAWAPAAGVPRRVVAHVVDDGHLLAEADIALGEVAEGESDPDALAALLAAVRAGVWERETVEAAVRLTPYEDDEELEDEPDPEAAVAVLDLYAPVLREALAADPAH
ncbi:hypothetical protein [Streptomyces thermolilacinus]|uniref:Uncharacterized protein n=1 Tax=Streptomyces thermolilacinus SPC6 TaxID=1306406 RepID=A0A1D3DTQ3_9ACTN|nr:hypothetical protein [Streptomyces thermolilacinus]OEJ95697.1 hypothetical protein J116_015590 [Streptomyces thermolilacinus SPC6]